MTLTVTAIESLDPSEPERTFAPPAPFAETLGVASVSVLRSGLEGAAGAPLPGATKSNSIFRHSAVPAAIGAPAGFQAGSPSHLRATRGPSVVTRSRVRT